MYASGCCLNHILRDYLLPDGDLRVTWCRTGTSDIPEWQYHRVYHLFRLQADAFCMFLGYLFSLSNSCVGCHHPRNAKSYVFL